tara:strand:- start:2410 stop:2916 length:507 start_codon:yes stop_codon:yes gene_type:complete
MANSYSDFEVIRVTPTITAASVDAGEVLFTTTEIPNAVLGNGGCSKLMGVWIVSQSGAVQKDISLVFMENNTSIGDVNTTPDISDPDAEAVNFLGAITNIDAGNTDVDLGGVKILGGGTQLGQSSVAIPMLLQAAAGSTSVFFAGLAKEASDYEAADDLDFIFHIQKR